ncbi:MAG TPA: type IV pilus assembly protein PilM [Acidimicrobiales bacterium]|nr:type IV pilus assembly protein PilM [Acidimicrobiales bacterium]
MTRRIGIEVAATSVRIVEIDSGGSRAKVHAFGEAALPKGAVADGVVADRSAVKRTVAACLKNAHLERSKFGAPPEVWLAVAGLRAISREIVMPRVPDADLDAAVRLQALDIIPFPEEETLLSARTLGTVTAPDGTELVRVHLAAAHRALVEPLVDVLAESGLVVKGVDLASSALVRSLASEEPGVEAIVSIGAELTTIVIHELGEPHFVRTIAGGGNAVTRAISAALDIPAADAEQIKIRLGWSPTDAGRLPAEAVAAARDGSAPLLGEIRSSIDYFATLPGLPEVSRVVVTGGGSRLAGLVERLEYQVRVPVTTASWLEHVDTGRLSFDRIHADTVGAVAAGAAMTESAGRKALDLLPPEVLVERRRARTTRTIQSAAVIAVVALAAGGALRFLQVRNAEHGVGSIKGEIAHLQKQLPAYDRVQQQDNAIFADSRIGMPIVSHEVNWPAVFAALAKYTPASVSASGFSGSTAVAPTAATSASTGQVAGPSSALPSPTDTVGTVSLSFSGPQYPSFKEWFDAMVASARFEIVQYSGVSSSGHGVDFTAQLAVTGAIHTDRLAEFEVPKR